MTVWKLLGLTEVGVSVYEGNEWNEQQQLDREL